jgi:hypothetical protein
LKPYCLLSSSELCDLLNYMLGLPEIFAERTVTPAIDPCVVASWNIRPQRSGAESWCDARLLEVGIHLAVQPNAPPKSKFAGRHIRRNLPPEVGALLPSRLRGNLA